MSRTKDNFVEWCRVRNIKPQDLEEVVLQKKRMEAYFITDAGLPKTIEYLYEKLGADKLMGLLNDLAAAKTKRI